MSHGVVHFEIAADDPDKLADFYRGLFGWKIDKMPMADGSDYLMTQTVPTNDQGMPSEPGAINGGIFKRPAPDVRGANYINVESVSDFVQKAKGLGANVVVDRTPIPGMGYFAQMVDPQGNVFGLFEINQSAK